MEFVAVIFAEALHFLGALVVVGMVAGFAPEAGVGLDVDGARANTGASPTASTGVCACAGGDAWAVSGVLRTGLTCSRPL